MDQLVEQTIPPGRVIYEEGGPGDAVFIVTEGKVEVLRQVGKDRVRLGVLGKGAIFGESGVIRNKVRSTTVRAIEPVSIMVIPRAVFLAVFSRENPLGLKLLRALCDRLAQAQSKLLTHQLFSDAAPYDRVSSIHLLPDTQEMTAQIGSDGVKIDKLPFRVGRTLRSEERTAVRKAELAVQASHGDDLSPLHFAIENDEGRLVIRDLASHLGTLVAGRRIGHFEEFTVADLRFGSTPIQAGGVESPYRFIVVVARKNDVSSDT